MNNWLSFLTENGAQWQGETLVKFTHSSPTQPHMTPLLGYQLLLVQGPDAQKFLQGQTTCDMRLLQQNTFMRGAHCNAQGRMLSTFTAFNINPETIALRVPKDNLENALQALKKYSVFSKVQLLPAAWVGLHLEAPPPSTVSAPEIGRYAFSDEQTCLRHHDGSIEVWGSVDAMQKLAASLTHSRAFAPPDHFDLWRIQQGLAEVHHATTEQFLPQQLNLHLTQGISFKKGCYTGQEIVARIHYKGQVKKLCMRAIVDEYSSTIAVGSQILSAESNKEIGVVIDSAITTTQQELLVCTQPANAELGAALMVNNSALKITWAQLPYAIPIE